MGNKVLNVIKLTQSKGEFFVGTVLAQDLVDITYSDVRRIEDESRDVERYLGIQRPLDKARVAKIKKYLESPDASFPTGIVLSIDPNCAEFDPDNSTLILNEFRSDFDDLNIPLHKIAKVLDGQHRIAAFMNDQGNYDFSLNLEKFELNVVIFVGLDIDEQANIFATINLAQTKVNKSLVYDLEGLSKIKSPFRVAHKIAVALDEVDSNSPLYHRIKRLGVKTKGRANSEPLTQAVFVESLLKLISKDPFEDRTTLLRGYKLSLLNNNELNELPFRNLYIENREMEIALILYNYFKAIQTTWPDSWNDLATVGNLLPKSNAFKAFMRYLKVLYPQLVNKIGDIVTMEKFREHFSSYKIDDLDFSAGNFKHGSGGESTFYKILTKEITIQDLKE